MKAYDEDGTFLIPRKDIYPDPEQPRLKADAELEASIKAEGIIQALTVRPHPDPKKENAWMIIDGERRYLGAGAAGLKELPCRIRLDREDESDRLITQITANTGKPLAPIEQARAYTRILEADPKLSQAELAKRVGVPRSTVGDRVRMLALSPVWLELLETGKIQASHTAILQPYTPVPEKYQQEVAKSYVADSRAQNFLKIGEAVPVEDFDSLMYELFGKHLRSLSKTAYPAWPDNAEKYVGPIMERKERYGGGKEKLAADPDIWRPILKRASSLRAATTREQTKSGKRPGVPAYLKLPPGCKTIKSSGYSYEPPKGFMKLVDSDGRWSFGNRLGRAHGSEGFDLDVLLANLDGSKLAIYDTGSGKRVITNDTAAMGKARSTWIDRWAVRRTELIADLRKVLTKVVKPASEATDPRYRVSGRGASVLIGELATALADSRGNDNAIARELMEIAEALEVDGATLPATLKNPIKWLMDLPEASATLLSSGYAAASSLKLDTVWDTLQEEQAAALNGYVKRKPDWKNIGKAADQTDATEDTEDEDDFSDEHYPDEDVEELEEVEA